MATSYGSDISTVTSGGVIDLDPYFRVVTGAEAVAHAIARRLTCPRGGLIDDEEYGFDLRELVNQPLTSSFSRDAAQEIEAQCLLDERVEAADVELSEEDGLLEVSVALTLYDGVTFTLVLAVSAVTVEILQGA